MNNIKKRLPIGYEDFKEIINEDLYYVDKTLFICEIIPLPCDFGNTLNFSILR